MYAIRSYYARPAAEIYPVPDIPGPAAISFRLSDGWMSGIIRPILNSFCEAGGRRVSAATLIVSPGPGIICGH